MNNLDYFKYSQDNVDEFIDFLKPEGVLVVSKDKNEEPTYLMEQNKKLINLIITYETLRNENFDEAAQNKVLYSIIELIESTDKINYSAFCSYFQVLGFSYGTYMSKKDFIDIDNKCKLMKTLVELYLTNRHQMYTFLGYSDQVLQVNSDLASSRRKGKTGIEKIEKMINPKGFKKIKNINNIGEIKLGYLLPDKGDRILFNNILKQYNIKFDFRTSRQMKDPDMLLKIGNDFIILEHKLTNGGGGTQNSAINEIIQFIENGENDKNRHYVSCLQGDFFSKLKIGNKEPKAKSQYEDIINALDEYNSNFFVNGKGLENLVQDYIDKL